MADRLATDDGATAPAAAGAASRPATASSPGRRSRRRGSGQTLVRRIHVWTSMLSLAVMLFFGLTGILLNHEDWTLGVQPTHRSATGTLPATLRSGTGWDTLAVSRWLSSHEGLSGRVNGNGSTGDGLWISYLGPGYGARVVVEAATGGYTVSEDRQGWVGVVDDIHRAKGTGTPWRVVNDLAGALLAVIGATGLLITWLSRARHRRRDLLLAVAGLVLAGIAWWSAVR